MKQMIFIVCLTFIAVNCRHEDSYDDGSWKGEGLAESQYYGEGLAESMDYGGGPPDSHDYQSAGKSGPSHGYQSGGKSRPSHDYYSGYTSDFYDAAPIGEDGQVEDTPEVAYAKEQHLAAHDAARYGNLAPATLDSWAPPAPNEEGFEPKWPGPFANIELTNDGQFVKETPEVAHAREQHYQAYAETAARSPDYVRHRPAYDYNTY